MTVVPVAHVVFGTNKETAASSIDGRRGNDNFVQSYH